MNDRLGDNIQTETRRKLGEKYKKRMQEAWRTGGKVCVSVTGVLEEE